MRIRTLLAGLVLGVALVAAPTVVDASSPTCRAAQTAESGASDVIDGIGVYSGTATTTSDGALGQPATRSSGTLSGRVDLASDACRTITYTVVAVHTDTGLTALPVDDQPSVELARTSDLSWQGGDRDTLHFAFAVPDHPGSCVQFYVTTSYEDATLDRAPNEDEPLNSACIEDGGTPGGQFWN